MLNEDVNKALNDQINAEIYSSYLYLAMSAHCYTKELSGMAGWFKIQAQEELVHVAKFFNYINERGGKVVLSAVDAPNQEWDTPLAVFEEALGHEQHVSSLINNLVEVAVGAKDRMTENFLQWFVAEQVEEEASFSEIVGQLRMVGGSGSGLYMIDRELVKRVFALEPGVTI